MVQVGADHYSFEDYDHLERWTSYWYQLRDLQRLKPRSVLLIGDGSGVVSAYLKSRTSIEVCTADFDHALAPDVVSDIRDLSTTFGRSAYDVVAAFQVLEHIPRADLPSALEAMSWVADRYVLMSVPVAGRFLSLRARWMHYRFAFGTKIRLGPRKWQFDGEHYWEIGTDKMSKSEFCSLVGWDSILNTYVYPDYPYHMSVLARPQR